MLTKQICQEIIEEIEANYAPEWVCGFEGFLTDHPPLTDLPLTDHPPQNSLTDLDQLEKKALTDLDRLGFQCSGDRLGNSLYATFDLAREDAFTQLMHLRECGLNLVGVPRGTKKTVEKWERLQTVKNSYEELHRWANQRGNAAILTGHISGIVAVDCDTPEAREEASKNLPYTPIRTLSSFRGQNGFRGEHWFYKCPPGVQTSNKVRMRGLSGLDFRGDGGYVLAPGSLHPDGMLYDAVGPWTPEGFAALPELPLSFLPEPEPPPVAAVRQDVSQDQAYRRVAAYMTTVDPAIQGQGGDAMTLLACNKALDFYDDDEVCMSLLLTWNQSCQPPWREKELRQKLASARKSRKNAPGSKADRADFVRITPTYNLPNFPLEQAEIPMEATPRIVKQVAAQPPDRKKEEEPSSDDSFKANKVDLPDEVTGPDGFTNTDTGNAERFVWMYGTEVRYVADWKSWLIFDGRKWGPDPEMSQESELEIKRMSQELLQELLSEHKDLVGFRRHLLESLDSNKINSLKACCEFQKGIPTNSQALDHGPYLFNVKNGTLDLRTGLLRPHRREDLLRMITDIPYNPEATCPRWKRFLLEIMGGDQELVDYLQRLIGYTLTGETKEQCFYFLFGGGSNGKSTFLEVVKELLGSYSKTANFSTFVDSKTEKEGPRTDIARLVGSRFVSASEASPGKALDMALLKTLTGEERVTARFLYSREFEFLPTCKIFLAANHKPPIKDNSDGAWRRIHLIPFTVKFEKNLDADLRSKLFSELPGILAWAVAGCLAWQKTGLQPPKVVREASQSYQDEMDPVGQFITDRCVTGHYDAYSSSMTSLYGEYQNWCTENGETPWKTRTFNQAVEHRKCKKLRTNTSWRWLGIGIKSDIPDPGDKQQGQLDIPG